MTSQLTTVEKARLPFLLSLVQPLDESLYEEALLSMNALEKGYDAKSQTSNIPVYAGTSLTYVTTGTGLAGLVDSDTKAKDA